MGTYPHDLMAMRGRTHCWAGKELRLRKASRPESRGEDVAGPSTSLNHLFSAERKLGSEACAVLRGFSLKKKKKTHNGKARIRYN